MVWNTSGQPELRQDWHRQKSPDAALEASPEDLHLIENGRHDGQHIDEPTLQQPLAQLQHGSMIALLVMAQYSHPLHSGRRNGSSKSSTPW
jgi:hypothetical protein